MGSGISDYLLEIYAQNKDDVDWTKSSRQIGAALGISPTSAGKLKKLRNEAQGKVPVTSDVFKYRDTPRPTHLVIGDAHAAPGQSLGRFLLLGRMIRDIRPDVVICIGDWADMESLSHYDKGKRSFEGRRYSRDVDAANEALALLHRPLDEHNAEFPDSPVRPRFVYCEGNHEYRIERAKIDSPGIDAIDLSDIDFERRGWEVHRFLKPVKIDGVIYCHYLTSQNTARAIGGVNAARSLLLKKHISCVVGHSHLLNYTTTMAGIDRRMHALVCGWYCDVAQTYAEQSNAGWWPGICLLRRVDEGDYDLELWSMRRIRERWKNR
jgi:hypothetical protein